MMDNPERNDGFDILLKKKPIKSHKDESFDLDALLKEKRSFPFSNIPLYFRFRDLNNTVESPNVNRPVTAVEVGLKFSF